MAENTYTGQNEDPKYRKKVYDILSSNFEDFKLSESDFYKKLDSDTGYAPKVYKVLKDNFADFEKPEKDFMSLVGPSKKKDLFGKITTYVGQLQKEAGEALGGVKKGLETVAAAAAQYEKRAPRTSGPVEEKVKVEVEEKLDPNDLVGSFKKRLAPLAAPSIPVADAAYVRPNMNAIFSEQEKKRPEVAKRLEQEKAYKDLKNAFLTDENLSVTQLMKATGLSAEAIKGASREDIMKMARPGNETDKLAAESVAEAQDINAAFSQSRSLEEAAIRLAASKDPQIARQLEITSRKAPAKNLQEIVSGTKDIMADPKTMFGEATIGRFIYQLATNPIAVQQIEKNPNLKKQFKETLPLLINKYPDFGKSYLGNVISQKMEDMGINNALLNVVTKEETDKAVEQLESEGKISPIEVQFYKDNMREGGFRNFTKTLIGEQLYKTPGLIERTLESAVGAVKSTGTGLMELTGARQALVGERRITARDIAAQDMAVNIKPRNTINEMTAYGGDFLGQILPTGLMGKGLTSLKLFKDPNTSIKALFGLQAFGNYLPQARAQFPGEELKQRAYAGILASLEIATENIFQDKKIVDGLMGKIKPEVANVIRQFTDKQISAAAARETIQGYIKNAFQSVPQYTKYFGKAVGQNTVEETAVQLGEQLTDGVFTGKKYDDWINGEELLETARTSALGSVLIGGLAARADMMKAKGITAKMIYDMAEKPDYWVAKIKEGAALDPDLAADADDKIANLEYASKVRQDLESTSLSEKQKIKYLINALEANVKAKSSQGITDPVLKKKAEQQAKEVEKQQEAILNGDDQGEIEGDLSDETFVEPQIIVFPEEDIEAGEVAPEVPKSNVEQQKESIAKAIKEAGYDATPEQLDEIYNGVIDGNGEIEPEKVRRILKSGYTGANIAAEYINELDIKAVEEVTPESVEEAIGAKPTPTKVKVLGKEVNMYNDYIPSKVEDVEPDAMYSFSADSKDGIPSILRDVAYVNKREVNGVKTENWYASISGDELLKLYPKKVTAGEVAPEVPQTVEQLRAAEQAEYAAMTDPNDEVKRQEIYDKYDKLITPLLEKEKEVPAAPEDIEVKRQETESRIKRKDLFIGVGEFSTQLGGSDAAAVPVSHKEINGIELVEYAHPKTGSVDVIVTGTSNNDFVGFYRIYQNGKPTNKWSSKFENQSRNKENFKTMLSGVQEMLPEGHEYTEKTSISTDGLRIWNQQLNRGYELQYDENGKLITNRVFINGDAIVNELGIPVKKGEFENINVTNTEDFEKVKKALLPYLEKFGLGENNVKAISGSVAIDLPVLKKSGSKKTTSVEVAPEVPAATKAAAPVPSIIEVKSPKEVKQGDTVVWRGEDFIVEEVNPKGGFNLRNAADRTNTVKDARITDEEFQGKRGEVAAAPKVEKFGVGFAPFREKNVFTEEEDVDIRTSPDYQLHQENVQKVAQGLGIKINNKLDTWGGYVDMETGRPVQEVSNIMEIEATPEQARVMAAILGKAAPEMQDSVLLGNYNENGAGFEHIVKTGSFANAQEAIKLLKDNGLQYFSIDKKSGDVIILDLDATDTPKIVNLVKQLNENGIPAKHKYGKVNAEFVTSGSYDGIIEAERSRVRTETGFDIDAFVQEATGKYDAIKAARTQPVVSEVQKSIADKIRGLKIDLSKLGDGGAQSNIAGLPVALYNTVVEAVALAVEAGVSINKAINDAIKEYKLSKVKDFDKDAFVGEVLKGIEITDIDANPVYFENLKKFASESSFDNKIKFKNAIQNLFEKYLPELKNKFGKDFDPSKYDNLTKKYLVDLITKESLNAIKEHPEAIGWYDEKTQSALDVISAIHPEIATDAEARGAFILPLAVMSNGNKVDFNFELAEKQYQYFKENGRFNPNGNFGLQQSGIKKSLMLINSLLDNGLTMSDINNFLTSKYRAGDLNVIVKNKKKNLASGELADEQVYGAVILGPKIGNGFYMNLWGQFDQLTMDRWFMRTWGRMTGTLIKKDAAEIAKGKKRLSEALDEVKKDSDALAILKSVLPKISSLSIQDLSKSIEKASMDKKKRAALASNENTDELRKAANSLSKKISGEKEAPSTGKERRFIRKVFTDVVNDLKNKYGIEISMADLQAALWYPEKILYESFKGGETFEEAAEGYTSESAPDYLNAAKKLATKLEINEEQVNQALSRGRERAERIAGEGYPEGGRAISESYQDILGRIKEAIGGKQATGKVRAAAKTVRSLKIKQEGLQANIAGIPIALYNAALETIATALEAGASLTDAIREAIRKHKLNKQKDFDSDTFVKQLESVTGQTVEKIGGKYAIQIEAAGEVPVQPKAGVSEEVEGGVPGAKPQAAPEEGKAEGEEEKVRVSGIKKGLVSQEVLSRVNLNTVGDKELLESGRAIIESGEVKPKTVVNRVIDGGQGVLTPAEVVAMITYKADLDTKQEDLSKEIERRTKAGEDLGDLLVEYKDLQVEIDNYDIAAVITAQQQSLAFRLRRYLLDREYNITVQINRYKQTNGGTIPESVLAKFKKLNETIKDLRKKIKEAEAVKYEEDSKAAMQNIIEDVERENQANGPKLYTEQELEDKVKEGVQKEIDGIYAKMPAEKKSKAQRVVDALDNIQRKLRNKTYDASLGVPVAFIDAGITAIKNAIKLGIEVEKAIEIGIKTIKEKLNGAKWDKEADFRKDMMEGFKTEGVDVKKTKEVKARINDDGTITIPNKDIRDFVSQGIEDIDDLADAILNKYQAELPGVSSRQVRDGITKYGKEVSQTRDDISIKLGRAKRVGRLLSELEDLRTMDKGAFLLKYQRVKPAKDKISEREKNLKYLIRQLGREIMGDEQLPDNYDEQKALDTAKNRVSRRIEELRDKIKRGDFSKKQKRRVQADQELLDLQTQLENTKSQFDLEHEKNEQKNKKWYQKAGDFVLELFSGIPRTLVTGFDLGIVFTQGIRKVFTNPRMSAKAFVEAGKQFFSESRQRRMEQELKLSGAYALIKNSGLAISEGAEKASAQEQIFIVNYVNLIWDTFSRVITLNYKPGTDFVKALNPFKASQRFFDGYLNYIRINSFLDLSNAIGKDGYMPETHPEIYKAAAEFVNTTTGKGAKNIPKSLGFLMFSASKVASELKLYTPYAFFYYAKMPKAVRKRAMLEFGTFALSFGTTMFLMRAALGQGQGGEDDDEFWDINSSNFLTFKFGNQRVSFAAGARPTLVFMGRLFSGVYVDQYGQESKLGERTGKQINTKYDLIVRFFTAKAAPVPAAAIQYLDKKAGVEVEDNVFQNLVLPMWLQDSQELYAQNPKEIGALYTLISLIGANVRTVEEYTQKEHKMPQKISYTDDYSRKREVVLTDEQKADFQKMFNEKFKKNIDDIHNSETYKKLESKNDKILFDVVYGKKAKDDAESDAKKELIRKYRGPFSEFPIIRETPEEKEINRILNRGEKR